MDNVCHTLVGAAFGAAGLNRRTRFAGATLMVTANLPDIDVLAFATGEAWIAFRRGWTHGILAQLALPAAWTAALWLVDRCARARAGGDGIPAAAAPAALPFHPGWTLLLAFVGVYSHVFLDFLNNYGIRIASPICWRWSYGDALFIIDPWMWIVLGAGVWLARTRGRPRPARLALVIAGCYVSAMLTSGWVARGMVARQWREMHGTQPRALMVGPLPVWPFGRQVIVDAGSHYEYGTFSWFRRTAAFAPEKVPKNDTAPDVEVARRDENVRAFLVWSRFPVWTIEPTPAGTRVTVSDMRFRGGARFSASTTLPAVGQ